MDCDFEAPGRCIVHRILRSLNRVWMLFVVSEGLAWSAETTPLSWSREVRPIFKRSCDGCHNPDKLKGGVDTSTYGGFMKPGKNGPSFMPGEPARSLLMEKISGNDPAMPKEGDRLTAGEIAIIERWIREGGTNDIPLPAPSSTVRRQPFRYASPPVITTMASSPDGKWLAVGAYHEVLLFGLPEMELRARLVGESPRIESLEFSPDGSRLALSGGVPGISGEIQVWDPVAELLTARYLMGADSLLGISWSPDGSRLAFGGADSRVRVIHAASGSEQILVDYHPDQVSRTAWSTSGLHVISGSRDRSIQWIDAVSGKRLNDIKPPTESLSTLVRHPHENILVMGGTEGCLKVYRMEERPEGGTAEGDLKEVLELERFSVPVQVLAISPDGSLLAAGGTDGELKVFRLTDGRRVAQFKSGDGPLFAASFSRDGKLLYCGGSDGLLRGVNPETGRLKLVMMPVPLTR